MPYEEKKGHGVNSGRLGKPILLSYSAAHYGKSLFWYMTELLFGFYLAEIYGIEPMTLGTLLLLFLVWDAVTDPLLAFLVTNRHTGTKSLLNMQLAGAVLSSTAFLLVFYKPPLEASSLIVYALLAGVFFRTAYTLYDVPQNALMKRLSKSNQQRLTLSSLRVAFGALAKLTISLAVVTILSGEDVESRAHWFLVFSFAFSLFAVGSAWLLRLATRNLTEKTPAATRIDRKMLVRHLFDYKFTSLFAASLMLSIGWPLFGRLIPFFTEYVLNNPRSAGLMIGTIAVATLSSQPIWLNIGNRVSRKTLAILIIISSWIASFVFFLFAARSILTAVIAVALFSAASGAANMLQWAILADRLSAQKVQDVDDLVIFGGFTFSSKVAFGLGGFLLGGVLLLSDYAPGSGFGQNRQVLLLAVMAFAPAISTTLAMTIILHSSKMLNKLSDT